MSDFVLAEAVWLVRRGTDPSPTLGELASQLWIAKAKTPEDQAVYLPVFTDQDLAETFINKGPRGLSAFRFTDFRQLEALLVAMARTRETVVAIDLESTHGVFFSIDEFIRIVRRDYGPT